ncbi:MAG TPA: HlyD family secretion protein [Usitatibacter sp.]|jgi:membrane fusion protein (multidrug efflux system)|nr:HlyD family secretion protein [Usitatibacter sp.]
MAATTPDDPSIPEARPEPKRGSRRPRRKHLAWIVIAVIVVIAAVAGFHFWHQASLFESTDDAYLDANQAEIAAQITGPVIRVYVKDQQHVKAGDALFDIDPGNYELAVARARAQLELARQGVSSQGAAVSTAEAQLAQRRAEAANARGTYNRNEQLMKSGFLSPQAIETFRSQMQSADAAVKAAEATVEQAKSMLGKTGDQNANVLAAEAALKQADLDLARTHVASPTNGVIANFTLQPGNTVQPGTPLFVVIDDSEYWVDANFKETQLKALRVGQKAEVTTDMYPDHVFEGVVQSLSGGSGAAFSLLPPQNATGNWVKVTQRVPVRVRVQNPDPNFPLRIGTTATVKVRKE